MKRDQIIIFVLVGIMIFSAIAFSLPLLLQDDESITSQTTSTEQQDSQADLLNQAAELNEDIPKDRYQPEGDVTELATEDLVAGDGEVVAPGDTVTVHYTGWLAADGSVFDSSYFRGEPATFSLNGVIEGWSEGMVGMKVGGERRLIVPSEMAYGPSGTGSIPANADLIFEVQLIGIE